MPQAPKNAHGIFCLETIWFDERSNPSTRSLLELLEGLQGVPFAYRGRQHQGGDEVLPWQVGRSINGEREKEKPAAISVG